ncbi:putative aldouronate transport system substrate-binding protein [Evansella vedderi]|uniref:Aldouronate transport system substrate-binding protein n=1 Tax=Evansella vedderi TaxID=38282 RepID=A0ABT9ZXF4_9BACI|nr:extracellular solute-binding protein [Evansella vedderi]MDQ0255907.1 putative aldouronate transport system substrate-binding protein [Evansella vedderi]
MFKKLLFLMALSLLLVFAACSNDSESTTNTNDGDDSSDAADTELESVTFHFFNAAAPGRDIETKDTVIGEMLYERTGVNFRLEHIVGDINQRIGTMVAGGIYPDVIVPDAELPTLMDAEALIPLDDLLEEYGQNILEAYADYLHMFRHDDGKIYHIPFGPTVNEFVPNPNIDQGAFWVQLGVLRDAGFPEINTLDEYMDLIISYAEANPEIDGMRTIPFTGLTYDWRFFAFSNVPNHLAGYPNDGGVMIDMETHEASVYADSEYAKEWLRVLNELNANGHLDQEMFVMNYDEYLAKLSSGRVLGFFDYGWQFGNARNAIRDAGNPDREYIALPVVFDGVEKDQYLDPPAFVGNRGIAITTAAENPERIVQFWNELITEEMQRYVMWGFEDEHYSVNEEGRFYQTEEQMALLENQDFRQEFGMTVFEWNWPRLNGSFSDGNAIEARRQPEVALLAYRDYEKEVLEAYGVNTFAEMFAQPDERPWYPAWSITIEQGSPEHIFQERSSELLRRHYARIVLADPTDFENEWNDFVEAYRALDVEGYENFFTEKVQARVNGEW